MKEVADDLVKEDKINKADEQEPIYMKDGIPALYFIKVCKLMLERNPIIVEKMMIALDLSLENRDSVVDFNDFLQMSSLFKYHSAPR